ncbi:hypothetical protein GCM10010172_19520 [Paractinoplanes ferrugineus]|uniref:Metallo-oxidoreductase n=1 Tax=Paractinoplanes ferrugineus TaxID=113564 RepID=A0A919MQD6_9ACTN|nr:multicopper oxidase family protein [Actinoplanes ferrugineus]GIE16217.1 metallo-oxidoreductase [Actinoplanes ferrugineus]
MTRSRIRTAVALVATAAILGPLGYFWQASLLPDAYSMMSMGYLDDGGGPAVHQHAGGVPVTQLRADPDRRPDVDVTLTARKGSFTLASGQKVDGYTLNGTSPGPTIRAKVGQLVQVRLVNESVPDGATLHWHGVDVPNADDGVAGVTQDAVGVGGSFTYRFVADRAGTFWYHSHQISHEQVRGGLLGALVVDPAKPVPDETDFVALMHQYRGYSTVNGSSEPAAVPAEPGRKVRVRVINTENGLVPVWVSGASFRVLAVDGSEVNGPAEVRDTALNLPAGGRVDLGLTVPATGARVEIGGAAAVTLGPAVAASPRPGATLDLLSYGTPQAVPFDPDRAVRHFKYDINRRPGFVRGRPGLFWTINGHLYPDVPMFMVRTGDVARMTISNNSGESHPMHLHGHRLLVLARDGTRATGSPWWTDSLEVPAGESFDVAFVADNPGIWADHCHNLPHAADGMVAHLMYEGITTPYVIGGAASNIPE